MRYDLKTIAEYIETRNINELKKIIGRDNILEVIKNIPAEIRFKFLNVALDLFEERELIAWFKFEKDEQILSRLLKLMSKTTVKNNIALFIDALKSFDSRIRANAIEAIESTGDKELIRFILPFLEDTSNRVRANAAKALYNYGYSHVQSTIKKMLLDEDIFMKVSACYVIGQLKADEFLKDVLNLLEYPNEYVKEKALETLKSLKNSEADEKLFEIINDASNTDIIIAKAIMAISSYSREQFENLAVKFITLPDTPWLLKKVFLQKTAGFISERLTDLLKNVILNKDLDLTLRVEALQSIHFISKLEGCEFLLILIKDPEEYHIIREKAVDKLMKIASVSYIDRLQEVLNFENRKYILKIIEKLEVRL